MDRSAALPRDLEVELSRQPVRHAPQRRDRRLQRSPADGRNPVELLAAAAALGRRLAPPPDGKSFLFKPFERLVDGGDGDVAPRAPPDLVVDRDAVALVSEPDE